MKRIPTRAFLALPLSVSAAAMLTTTAVRAGALEPVQSKSPSLSAETGALTNETPKMWFVEYPTAPLAEGTRDADVDADDQKFRGEASSKGVDFKQRLRFKSLFNGISIEAKPSAIAKIRHFSSV